MGRVYVSADILLRLVARMRAARENLIALLQTIQYRILNQPRFRRRLGGFSTSLEIMARRLNDQILALEAKERELLRRVELISALNGGWSVPSWLGGSFFTPVSRIVTGISVIGMYRSPLVLAGIGRRIYLGGVTRTPDYTRVSRVIPARLRGGYGLDRDDVNRLAAGGTFVNQGPTPQEMAASGLGRDEINRLAQQGTFVNEGPTPEEMARARLFGGGRG